MAGRDRDRVFAGVPVQFVKTCVLRRPSANSLADYFTTVLVRPHGVLLLVIDLAPARCRIKSLLSVIASYSVFLLLPSHS